MKGNLLILSTLSCNSPSQSGDHTIQPGLRDIIGAGRKPSALGDQTTGPYARRHLRQ